MQDVALATLTWVRDPEEERLVGAAVTRMSGSGLPVAVSDGGSPAAFTALLAGLPGVQVVPPEHQGLVGQTRASLRAAGATGRRFILYLESDKDMFVAGRMPGFISSAPDGDDVGVVLAARSAASLATFPPTQRFTESTFNVLAGESLGSPTDYLYGPFLLNRALIPAVDRADPGLGWGWRPYLFALAIRRGFRVLAIEGDHPCPAGQRAEGDADRIHRMRQLGQNVNGLVEGLTMPLAGRGFPSGARGV